MNAYRIILMAIMVCFISIGTPTNAETVENCDFESLKSVIMRLNQTDGGEINFACAGTIRFTETVFITSAITINGHDDLILDGYGLYTLFDVDGTLSLNKFIIQKGWTAIQNKGTLTITDSLLRDNQAYSDGAVIVNNGTVFISNSQFIGNETDSGGAIVNSGDMTITDSTFSMNKAYRYGGVIFNSANLTIEHSHFVQNSSDLSGGAIHNTGYLNITTSTFDDNSSREGGAILDNQNLTIHDSIFTNNQATFGGAIEADGKAVILNSQFVNNSVTASGGAIYSEGELTVRSSYFEGNTAKYDGGAISDLYYAPEVITMTVSHSTFVNNTAEKYGGAIVHNNENSFNIHTNTFLNNHAKFGGAIYNHDDAPATIQYNTFVDNAARIGGAIYNNSLVPIQYNLISGTGSQCSGLYVRQIDDTNQTDYRCGDAIQVDDLMLGEFDGQVFPLLVGSPAIDAYSAPCRVNRDQLGMIRPNGDRCDAGATEFTPEGTVVLSEPQSITLTNCTWQNFYDTVGLLNWVGGEIVLNCPADRIIPFDAIQTIYAPLVITSQTPIRLVGDGNSQLFIIDASADVTLIGMTIEGGKGTHGGAIENYGALTLREMTFTTNQAVQGGAVYNNGVLTIENSQLSDNHAQVGGAIYNNSVLTSHESSYMNNTAERQSEDKLKPFRQQETIANPAIGGAIYTNNSLTVTNSQFEHNSATDSGGAIGNDEDGRMTITESQFIGNIANQGGAVAHASTEERERLLEICDCGFYPYIYITQGHFEENRALKGGAIYNALIMDIKDSLFIHNIAEDTGGAINSIDEIYLSQSTFVENHADKGGALHGHTYGYGNNTFIGNSATSEGGALYMSSTHSSTFLDNIAPLGGAIFSSSATRSIIWGDGVQCHAFDRWDSANNSISNTPCGEARVVDDVGLGEFDGWVVPLLPDSPAIDAYNCDGNHIEPLRDQLGTPRPQGELCDLGAVEFVPDAP